MFTNIIKSAEPSRKVPSDAMRLRRALPEVGHVRPRALHKMRILCVLVLLGPLVGQPGLHHQDPPGYRFFASGPRRTASGEVRYIDAPCNSEGQPRDGVATWLVQDNATTFGCARMCDVEPACTAFEINGCRRRGGACAGKCFLLSLASINTTSTVPGRPSRCCTCTSIYGLDPQISCCEPAR